jgi:hypothetical protein|tara:strand:- start:798 stop:1343 length:546 start_codon:yes stop_codon:yes gene_type:complete
MGNKNQLTNRQKEFAKYIVEGIYSNSKCARLSGYAEDSSHIQASKLLNGKDFPLVTEYIKQLREEREKKYGVTLIGQLKRFSELSHKAEEEGQFSASINAEKIRSALGGLSVDKREVQNVHTIDKLSRDEIVARLSELRKAHSYAFEGQYKRIEDGENREDIINSTETKPTQEDVLSEDRK